MDVGLPTDAKILTLPSDSHRWLWTCVLCSAGKERKSGFIGASYDAKYFSRITDFTDDEIPEALSVLAKLEEPLIELREDGIQVLNWSRIQSDAEYMADYRDRAKEEKPQCKENNLTKLPEEEKRRDKNREDKILHICEFWCSLPNLQQPQKIKPEDKKAVDFRLGEGATVEEIEGVLTWYDAELGNPSTWYGGNNERGTPVKHNIRRVMKGKLASDRTTYVYEHFLGLSKSKPVTRSRTGTAYTGRVGGGRSFIR